MRYGNPSIEQAIYDVKECEQITVLPLYPQYSSAATGSSIEEVMRIVSKMEVIPSVSIIRDFYQHPAYIFSQVQLIKNYIGNGVHLLFSYHGIPERQILKSSCEKICSGFCASVSMNNQGCYRAQCYQTSYLIAQELKLSSNQYSTSFQSQLGKIPWIKPYTDEILKDLIEKGVKHLAVACPSFTADCLETLEEIGMRGKEQWLNLGGKEFTVVPCLNTNQLWIQGITNIVQ